SNHRTNGGICKIPDFTGNPRMPKRTVQLRVVYKRLNHRTPRLIKTLILDDPTTMLQKYVEPFTPRKEQCLSRQANGICVQNDYGCLNLIPPGVPHSTNLFSITSCHHGSRLAIRLIASSSYKKRHTIVIRRSNRLRQFLGKTVLMQNFVHIKRIRLPI